MSGAEATIDSRLIAGNGIAFSKVETTGNDPATFGLQNRRSPN